MPATPTDHDSGTESAALAQTATAQGSDTPPPGVGPALVKGDGLGRYTILETLGLDFGYVLMGPSADSLAPVVSSAPAGDPPPPFSWTVVRRVLRQGQAVLANDIQAEPEQKSVLLLVRCEFAQPVR